MTTRRLAWPAVAVLAAFFVAACSSGGGRTAAPSAAPSAAPASQAASTELTVLGAASLKGVLEKAKATYETANPGTTVTISTGSSTALETQIEQGAPSDVFLSADTANPQKLVDGGFAAGSPTVFAGNELTIITPADNPGGVSAPNDLAKSGLRIIAAGDEVPITKYATKLVANLATLPGAPANFVDAYNANVASKEEDVKSVVAKVELGEGDAGIVYVTDAAASSKVKTVAVTPDSANVPATYAGVTVKASRNPDAASKFLTWFAGPDGQAILSSFGFLPPPS